MAGLGTAQVKFKEYNKPVTDIQGTVLCTGDKIAYADSNGYMNLGYIDEISEDGQVYIHVVRSGSSYGGRSGYKQYAWPNRQVVATDW
jgi:hypothetical protein